LEYVWATSWGVSTRLIGALIMTHSDDNGLVLPPALAPIQVVIIPIYKSEEQLGQITEKIQPLIQKLKAKGISVKYDDDDSKRSGWKFNEYEVKGVPVRIAVGPRDLENHQAEVCRRDTLQKVNMPLETLDIEVEALLAEIQQNLFERTVKFREENTRKADTWDEFVDILDNQAGFVYAHWDGTPETEELIKEKAKATIRCIPFNNPLEEGKCILTGKPSKQRVLFARAY
jgi:prolyl-tRNA synthetase